jgi:hypothetical protein
LQIPLQRFRVNASRSVEKVPDYARNEEEKRTASDRINRIYGIEKHALRVFSWCWVPGGA